MLKCFQLLLFFQKNQDDMVKTEKATRNMQFPQKLKYLINDLEHFVLFETC